MSARCSEDAAEQDLWAWFADQARPVLARCCPTDQLALLERDWSELDARRTRALRGLQVGFLGNAGVGKSTLLNTLVADQVTLLPQGGVGPLTAQATLVRRSEEPFFRVTYHGRVRVLQLLWGLERHRPDVGVAPDITLEAGAIAEAERMIADDQRRGSFPDGWLRQAAHLVTGRQYGEDGPDYLLDGLRAAVRLAPRWGTRLRPADEQRLSRVRAVLELAAAGSSAERWGSSGDLREFLSELELHAAGFLSPLVRTLQVGWEAGSLPPGLVFVDLPGLGVANDESRRVTEEWLKHLDAVVLVVDRAGLSESSAVWLRSSRFLERLVDETSAHLVVVPVKLDLTADDGRRTERQLGPGPFRPWKEHYLEATRRARELVLGQLREEWKEQRGDPDAWTRASSRVVIEPACAREYLSILQADPDQPARLKDLADTGIPVLRQALAELARTHSGRLESERIAAEAALRDRVKHWLESPAASTGRQRYELLRLRESLEAQEKSRRRSRRGRSA